jgi:protein SCO1/2
VTGTVQAVYPAERQIKIAHEEVPGLMPAMTMSFDVADPALLEGVHEGAHVHFELEKTATLLRITRIAVLDGAGHAGVSGGSSAPSAPIDEPAPEFRLIDQQGRELALADLRGKAVLLDFIFTTCKGPCPILTAAHASLQQKLPPRLAERTHFVSISLDPAHDTPQRLRAYAETRGADLERWSFLTGDPDLVRSVIADYRVGAARDQSGEIVHLVVTFLIDPEGRIRQRYMGLEHSDQEILRDLEAVLS